VRLAISPTKAKRRAMKSRTILAAALALVTAVRAGDTPVAPAERAPADAKKTAQEELEAKFKKTLTDATMVGSWYLVTEGKSGEAKEDKYTITGATKLFGENWLIQARVQYGKADFTAPFPVKVKWAGDTPVITVDEVGIPGGAKFSARVMIYADTYAGTWSGGGHAGLMSGVIAKAKE
jgi:hypothetical protein